MKKLITVALLTAMLLFCFAGCGLKQSAVVVSGNAENIAYDATAAGVTGTLKTNLTGDAYMTGADDTWAGTVGTKPVAVENVTTVTTGPELAAVIADLASYTADDKIVLANSINLGGAAWTLSTATFKGTFDGQGNVIYGISATTAAVSGFFGKLDAGAVVKNVGLIGTFTLAHGGSGYLALNATPGTKAVTVSNVYCEVTATNSAATTGLFGKTTAGGTVKISNVEVAGTISAGSKNQTAGLVGAASSALEAENVIVSANISATGTEVSGFFGRFGGAEATITNCEVSSTIKGASMCGGYIGQGVSGCGDLTMKSCVFSGDITTDRCGGGLIGSYIPADGDNTPNSALSIDDCHVTGKVTAKTENHNNPYLGGMIGLIRAKTTTITNSSVNGNVSLSLTLKTNSSDRTKECAAAGGFVGGLNCDNSKVNGTLTMTGNTLGGTLAIYSADGDSIPHYAGLWVGGVRAKAGYIDTIQCLADNKIATGFALTSAGVASADTALAVKWWPGNGVAPVIIGAQTKANGANTDVRFVAALGDIAAETGVGFKVSIQKKGEAAPTVHEAYVTSVYKSINGTDGVVSTTYTAADFYSEYLATLVIEGIPADYFAEGAFKDCQIIITPFTATEAGDVVTPVNGTSATYGSISAE